MEVLPVLLDVGLSSNVSEVKALRYELIVLRDFTQMPNGGTDYFRPKLNDNRPFRVMGILFCSQKWHFSNDAIYVCG